MHPLIFNLGPTELIIILAIVLLLFGGSRLAGLGKSSGRALREFKEETKSLKGEDPQSPPPAAYPPPAATDAQQPPTYHQPPAPNVQQQPPAPTVHQQPPASYQQPTVSDPSIDEPRRDS